MAEQKQEDSIFSWLFRLVKGVIIGTGFIIPGVSGGVFAAIFGVYEPMIHFFASIRKDFIKNMKFFIPIGIGVLISMVLVSKVLGGVFETAEIPLIWFFVGCVLGTMPGLYRQAGEKGRETKHILLGIVTIVLMCAFLHLIQGILKTVRIPTESMLVWLIAGVLMGLGAIVPGLSPSNFLLYMSIYGAMMRRIGALDLAVLIPVVIGAMACFLLLSKAFDKLFERAYAGIYHVILGVIIASTIMIIPWGGKELESGGIASYTASLALICVLTCVTGIGLGYGMGLWEKKYKE